MLKVKRAFLYKPYDLRIEDVELKALESNQVLIKLKACGICGSDVECYEGKSAEGRYDIAPYTPGHEWAGEIVEIGSEVSALACGDRVTGDCVLDCGYCKNCKNGLMPSACLNMREVGFRPDSPGGMGNYLVLEEKFVHKFPDDWSFEEGALIEPFSVGYFGIWGNGGYVDASDRVIIFGAGVIGLSALITAKASSAKVIVIEPLENRRKMALNFGADMVVDTTACNLKEEIMNLTNGAGGSVVVEASGNDNAIASIFNVAGHSARVRLIGHSVGRKVPIEIGMTIWKTLSISGSGGTRTFLPRTIMFMDQIRDKADFKSLITHRYAFKEIYDAFDIAVKNKAEALKVILNFD